MISIRNINVCYKDKYNSSKALNNLSLDIEDGEFVTIMGKSGCGKTTLLNIIGGIRKPDSGELYFDNRNVFRMNDRQLASYRCKDVSFVLQHFALISEINVEKNIELPLNYQHKKAQNDSERIHKIMDDLGILDKKNNFPYQLSGGEQQRTAIARAIAADTKVILADEPTGALDMKTGQEIMTLFKRLNQEGKTIIMVTHDEDLAQLGNHRILMCDGKIISDCKL